MFTLFRPDSRTPEPFDFSDRSGVIVVVSDGANFHAG
jgi:hypothetical protein